MGTEDEFDIVVIGGGPGGYATALYGAAAGLRVAIVERDKVGGTCLHRGCVPAKEFLETAAVYRTVRSAGDFGVNVGEPDLEFSVSQDRKNGVVDKLFKGLSGLLKGRNVTVLSGTGTLEAGAGPLVLCLHGDPDVVGVHPDPEGHNGRRSCGQQ